MEKIGDFFAVRWSIFTGWSHIAFVIILKWLHTIKYLKSNQSLHRQIKPNMEFTENSNKTYTQLIANFKKTEQSTQSPKLY